MLKHPLSCKWCSTLKMTFNNKENPPLLFSCFLKLALCLTIDIQNNRRNPPCLYPYQYFFAVYCKSQLFAFKFVSPVTNICFFLHIY